MTTHNAQGRTSRPAITCKCGDTAPFIGMQVMRPLGFEQALYNCLSCDSSSAGPREPLADSEAPAAGCANGNQANNNADAAVRS